MQENQERVIISLDPDFNPTGNKHPNTIKKEMKADPDFLEMSEDEQNAIFERVDNLINSTDDINQYGTLSEMVQEASRWGYEDIRYQKNLIVNFNNLNENLPHLHKRHLLYTILYEKSRLFLLSENSIIRKILLIRTPPWQKITTNCYFPVSSYGSISTVQ